jgi:cell division transport system permease protein
LSNLWQIRYCAKEALANIRRHPGPSLAAVTSIAMLLFLAGISAWGWMGFERLSTNWKEKARLIIYLRDDAAPDQQDAIAKTLTGQWEVQKVHFVSKAEAMARMRESLDGQHNLLDGFEENPLPASFEATLRPEARRVTALDHVATAVKELPGVEDIEYGRPWLIKLDAISSVGRTAGLMGLALLVAALLLIINNTSKQSLYARLEEVEIFKLVGATPMLIRGPYIMEGALMGLVGGIMSGGALVLLLAFVEARYGVELKATFGLWPSMKLAWAVGGSVIALGLALGITGGTNAVRKTLRRLS